MTIPYTFAGATTAIPLAQLDANFASPITLGNVAMTLSNTYTSIGNLTLTNVTISSTSTPITVPQGGTGLTSLTAGYIPFGNGTGAFGNSANLFWDSTNSRLGIGTASPAYPLDVVGNAKASSNVFCGDAFAFVFGTGTTSYLTGSSSTNYISAVTNSVERMRVKSTGDIKIQNGNLLGWSDFSAGSTGVGVTASGENLLFYSSGSERMRITSGGVLLFGTSSTPSQVGGFVGSAVFASSGGSPSTTQQLGLVATSGDAAEFVMVGGNASNNRRACIRFYSLQYNSNPTWTMGVSLSQTNGDGNFVLINQSSVGVQLTNGSSSWSSYSDVRLKNVTGQITNALSSISKIRPIKFTWKSDLDNKPQVGLDAETVQSVIPEAVSSNKLPSNLNDDTEYLSVRYTEIIPHLVSAIQEQQAIIEQLKAKVGL